MAVWAVGDLQGCRDEFLRLLDRLRFDPARDRLWLTGDLVNRGPDSLGALRAVRALGDAATTVLGNHDLHLLAMAWAPDRVQRREAGLQAVLAAPDAAELLAWLAARPLLHHDAALGWTLVHAGLLPEWDLPLARTLAGEVAVALRERPAELLAGMYGDRPDRWDPALAGSDRLRIAINGLTRLRYVDAGGRLLMEFKGPPDVAPAGALPWFRHPARRHAGLRIAFGHWSALGFLQEPGLLGLDGGCVWGGALCAVRLDAAQAPVRLRCARQASAGH